MRASLFLVAVATVAASNAHDEERQKLIDHVNNHPTATWTAGHNPRFKGLPVGAAKKLCGVKEESLMRLQEARKNGDLTYFEAKAPIQDLPTDFDSEANWPKCAKVIGDIRDQSDCGCCWAFGAASAASDRLCIATDGASAVPLSAQDVCFCAEQDGCNGGTLDTPWNFIQRTGVVTGNQFNNTGGNFDGESFCSSFSLPHCHHHGPQGNDPYPAEGTPGCPAVHSSPACPAKCDPSATAPHANFTGDAYSYHGTVYHYGGEDTIAQAIMTDGPVEAAFTVYEDFENYVSGVYKHVSGNSLGGHAIRIVGWGVDNGVKYWKVANSWNPYW
jgi:cathepsin B